MKIVPPPLWDYLDPKGPKNAKKSIWAQKVYGRPFRPTLSVVCDPSTVLPENLIFVLCFQVEENWVYSSNGTFYVSDSIKKKNGQALCEFTPMVRGNDDFAVLNGNPIKPLEDGDTMPADYGTVKCVNSVGKVYKNIMLGISPQMNKIQLLPKVSNEGTGLNILMFGFDSTSRMTWMRNLPLSHKYFTETLGGVVMEGYNIVGDGTPAALLPILCGKSEPELPEARRGYANAQNVDGHPWIWNDLKDAGYMTQWGEDGASAGTFTYRMLGFKKQPVDHYLRPFNIRSEKQNSLHKPFCLGSLPRHVNMLNWVKDFYSVYRNTPKFSFVFHSEFTHGGYSQVRVVDKDLLQMLRDLENGGYLDNTLLILMADHGARFQAVRQTVQGKYEERMPYFAFRFPPKFQEKYPQAMKNLNTNAHRLTTPYDIHATFKHLLNFTQEQKGDVKHRGISVLKEIPIERSCKDADIDLFWCACSYINWKSISTRSPSVGKAAHALVDALNEITKSKRDDCHELKLKNVSSAVTFEPNPRDVLKFKQSSDVHGRVADLSDDMSASGEVWYQVTIETAPNRGKFEATVKYLPQEEKYITNENAISRINQYGNQPHCVQGKLPHLRPFCYCRTQRH